MNAVVLAETVPTTDPLSWLQYGVLGAVLFLIVTGYLWAKPSVDELKRNHAEDKRMWEERLIPTLERIANTLDKNNHELRVNTNELAELVEALKKER